MLLRSIPSQCSRATTVTSSYPNEPQCTINAHQCYPKPSQCALVSVLCHSAQCYPNVYLCRTARCQVPAPLTLLDGSGRAQLYAPRAPGFFFFWGVHFHAAGTDRRRVGKETLVTTTLLLLHAPSCYEVWILGADDKLSYSQPFVVPDGGRKQRGTRPKQPEEGFFYCLCLKCRRKMSEGVKDPCIGGCTQPGHRLVLSILCLRAYKIIPNFKDSYIYMSLSGWGWWFSVEDWQKRGK